MEPLVIANLVTALMTPQGPPIPQAHFQMIAPPGQGRQWVKNQRIKAFFKLGRALKVATEDDQADKELGYADKEQGKAPKTVVTLPEVARLLQKERHLW